MSKSKPILDAMLTGRHTAESLVSATGLPIEQVRRAIWNLRSAGYIDTQPESYTITEKGIARQKFVPKTPKAIIARKVAQRIEKRKARSIVEIAIENRPQLATVWSQPNA